MDPEKFSKEMLSYVYGELNEEETAEFEARVNAEPELAAELEDLRKVIAAGKRDFFFKGEVKDSDIEKSELQAEEMYRYFWKRKRKEYLLSKKFRSRVVYPIAASMAALMFLGNILIYISSPSLVYLYYFQDYSPVYYAQATIEATQSLQLHSTNEYAKGNYHLVAENMRTLMEYGELNTRGRFTLGAYDAFKEFYETIWDKKIDPLAIEQEEALWYLAMTSYKLNELQMAQKQFKAIAEMDGKRAKKAARLEQKINKLR